VRLVLVLIQLTLLARVVCMILNVQSTTTWLTLLYAASDLFVQPMRWLAANVNISLLAGTAFLTYLEFLLAMLAYAILSRLLVGLLRILLN
jgi:predicted transcriptional regulator